MEFQQVPETLVKCPFDVIASMKHIVSLCLSVGRRTGAGTQGSMARMGKTGLFVACVPWAMRVAAHVWRRPNSDMMHDKRDELVNQLRQFASHGHVNTGMTSAPVLPTKLL